MCRHFSQKYRGKVMKNRHSELPREMRKNSREILYTYNIIVIITTIIIIITSSSSSSSSPCYVLGSDSKFYFSLNNGKPFSRYLVHVFCLPFYKAKVMYRLPRLFPVNIISPPLTISTVLQLFITAYFLSQLPAS